MSCDCLLVMLTVPTSQENLMRTPHRFPLHFLFLLVAAGAVLAFAAPAFAINISVVGSGGQFGYFDLTTRAYTQVSGSITGAGDIRNIAYNESGLYITERTAGGTVLRTLSLTGAAGPSLGTIVTNGQADEQIGLSFSPGGTLYSVDYNQERLLTVNPANAAATVVGVVGYSTEVPILGKLAFVDSTLYGTIAAGGANGLYTFNLATGQATLRGNGGQAGLYSEMIAFGSGAELYGINGTALYQINTASGALTSLGAITGANLPSNIVAAVVPEPGSVGLMALAAVAFARRRRQMQGV